MPGAVLSSLVLICVFLHLLPTVVAYSFLRTNRSVKFSGQKSLALMDSAIVVMKYGGIHHCGVLVSDVEKSKLFYIDVFGFSDDSHLRPQTLPYPGAFLRVGGDQIHLMGLPNPDPTDGRPDHGGRDRHVALTVNNIDIIMSRLENKNIKYTLSKSGRRALFCRDLDGNAFEFVEETTL